MKKAQNMPYQSRTLGAEAWYRFKKNKLALGALAYFHSSGADGDHHDHHRPCHE